MAGFRVPQLAPLEAHVRTEFDCAAGEPRIVKETVGSSSLPPHVEMMGLIGLGNHPMEGASVAFEKAMA